MRHRNVVVVTTDDQGAWAMPHRMPELVMPHLENLLAQATEFTQCYCASPVCSPARASLLTGRMPSAHGVHDWLDGRHPDAEPATYLDTQPTTPQLLHAAGYRCAMAGKWHLGDSRDPAPGFTDWYAHRFGGGPYTGAPVWRDGEEAAEPRYFTEAVTDEALGFLAAVPPEQPFYLQVNYTAPHDPWIGEHPQRYLDLYAGCEFESVPRTGPHPWVAPRAKDFAAAFADPAAHLAGYCAALSAVDAQLGRILDALEASGRAPDTILVYQSDNGFACGHHGVWGKGNGTWPLNFWDASVLVPFLIRVPWLDTPATIGQPVSAARLHATLLDLLGIHAPADPLAAGGSFAGLLTGDTTRESEPVVVVDEYGGARMIRSGPFKLVHRFAGPDELYDLRGDPAESVNLIEEPGYSGTADRLRRDLAVWYADRATPEADAFTRDVRGHGQVHPLSAGYPDSRTYVHHDDGAHPPSAS